MILELIHPRMFPSGIHTRYRYRSTFGIRTPATANRRLSVNAKRPGLRWRKTTGMIPITRKPPARIKPNDRSSFRDGARCSLIENKFFSPIGIRFQRLLFLLEDEMVAENQHIHFGAHKASVRILRAADDRFTAHVE